MASIVTRSTTGLFHYADRTRIPESGLRFDFDAQWSGIPVVEARVEVIDAAELADPPRFDREGLETLHLGIPPVDPRDSQALENVWRPAVIRAVQRLTGANAVASWSLGARFSEREGNAPRSDVSNPARRVHGDFAPSEFGHEVQHGLARTAIDAVSDGRRLVRWIGLNVWQALSPPPHDTPLALCDTRTVAPEDLVVGRGSAPSRRDIEIDLPLFCHSPRHRWLYWSRLAPDEAIVFSGIDSSAPGDWRLVPHSAFDDPACPAGAPPRSSVEIRCMALFFS